MCRRRFLGELIMPTTTNQRITKTSGVCGGDACIVGTRIPVWGLVNHCRLRGSDVGILDSYPDLTKADIEAAWEYARLHSDEIELAIRKNEQDEAE
jgi:uncharacterized protein (DUF433 family)